MIIDPENVDPKNLDEAMELIEKNSRPDELPRFISLSEEELHHTHFGMGMWIRNAWIHSAPGAPEKSLRKFFSALGIFHPDDMSGIVIRSLHRKLNNKPIELESQIQYYKDYWEKARATHKDAATINVSLDENGDVQLRQTSKGDSGNG